MISSASNSKIKFIRALNSKRKERIQSGLFAAEGLKLLKEAPPELIKEIYISESCVEEVSGILEDKNISGKKDTEIIADSLFKSICDTKEPQGVLTVLRQPESSFEEILKKKDPFFVILENVQDPGNVGTIVRTAEGAGADAVILSRGCADVFSPKTIRSTMGSVFRVPLVITEDPAETVRMLREKGISTYAAMPGAQREYDEPDYRKGTAVLIGNEGNGLSPELAAQADEALRIPMEGQLESLNAGIAAAIMMYAVHSKRKLK